MESTKTSMKSRACFAVFASLVLASCEAEVEGKSEAAGTTAPKMEKVVRSSEPVIIQVSRPVVQIAAAPPDLERASMTVARQQIQEQVQDHGQHLRKISRHSGDIRTEVAEIRWRLVLKRYDQLEVQAKKYRWSETKGPKEGGSYREEYREWLYLTRYLDEMLRYGPPNLTFSPNQVADELDEVRLGKVGDAVLSPSSTSRPKRPKGTKRGAGYRPQWVK